MSKQIIQGLTQHTAVKFGDVYVVCLSSNKYRIDGIDYIPQYGTNYQVVVQSLEDIYLVRRGFRAVSHYIKKDGAIISVEEFKAAQEEIAPYVTEDDEYDFPDLDTEFEVRKRLEPILQAETIYKEVEETLIKVEIDLIGTQEETGSDFISTPYVLGKVSFGGAGIYRVHLSSIAANEFHKFAKDFEMDAEVPTHSHLEYAKIGKTYAFTGYKPAWISRSDSVNYFGNLEQAKECEAEIRKQVRKHLQMRFTDLTMKELKASEFYEQLQKITAKVSALDVKQRNRNEHLYAVKELRDLSGKLVKYVEEASE